MTIGILFKHSLRQSKSVVDCRSSELKLLRMRSFVKLYDNRHKQVAMGCRVMKLTARALWSVVCTDTFGLWCVPTHFVCCVYRHVWSVVCTAHF